MIQVLLALFLVFGTWKLIQYLIWLQSPLVQLIKKIPGPKMVPIFGLAPFVPRKSDELLEIIQDKFVKEYGPVFQVWLWSQPVVLISSPTSMETVLASQKLIEKSDAYDFLLPWLGTGLLIAGQDKWKRNRRLLTPAFHFQILENFFDVFNKNSDIFCSQLSKGIADKPNQEIDLFPYCKKCTLDIICETAMGIEVNAQTSDSDYLQAVNRIAEILSTAAFSPWQFFPDFLYRLLSSEGKEYFHCLNLIQDFITKVIAERKSEILREIQQNTDDQNEEDSAIGMKKRRAFLDLMLIEAQNGANLTDSDIRNEVNTFMFEGHDTTSGALAWFLYCMGTNPKQQELVHQELDEIFGESDRPCTMEDAGNLKYLECCMKESSRLFPSVPAIERKATEDVELDGFKVPAGTTISILIYALHRNEETFPDALAYKPERFLPDESIGRNPFAFVPFSAGPRNCIGQRFAFYEEKVIISSLMRRFHFTYDMEKNGAPIPSAELILKPKNGMPLLVTLRR